MRKIDFDENDDNDDEINEKGTIHDVINGWQQNNVDVGGDDAE